MPRPNRNPAPAERASAFDRMMDVAHARAGHRTRTSTASRALMPTPPATAPGPSQTVRKKRLFVPDSTTDDDEDRDGAQPGKVEKVAVWTPEPTHDVVVLDDSDSNDESPLNTAAPAVVGSETVIKSLSCTSRRRAHVVSDSDGDGDCEGESAPVITSPRSRARSKRSRHIASDSDSDDADAPVAKVRRRAPPVIEDDGSDGSGVELVPPTSTITSPRIRVCRAIKVAVPSDDEDDGVGAPASPGKMEVDDEDDVEDFDVDTSNIIKSTETRKRSRGSIRDRLDRARSNRTATAAAVPSWTAAITVPGASGSDSDGSDDEADGGTASDMSLTNNVLGDEDAGSELEGFIASDAEDTETEGASAAAIPLAFRNLSEMDWFTLFIRFLIRVVVAPKVANALRRNREHPFTEGWYKVLEQIQSREQVMQSTVWSAELKEALETYPQAKETSDPIMSECQACNRGDRTTSARITLSGAPYDPKTLQAYETEKGDSESDSSSSTNGSGSDSDGDSNTDSSASTSSSPPPTTATWHKFVISAGRFCAMRLIGYHTLHHYIYHCARRLRTALGTADLDLESAESAFETAQIMLGIGVEDEDEDGFIVEEFHRFERMLEDADDTLSNRVGALERTRRGGGAGRWGR
ncbi:hypothetical protein GGF31_001974 [Allomyces arbusculus]|nr:hypothetical protein GGF31_001974 [Allomyces arbusculus]